MWTIQEVKEKGKAAFKANYWPCVGVGLLMSVLTGGTTFSSGAQGNSTELQNAAVIALKKSSSSLPFQA